MRKGVLLPLLAAVAFGADRPVQQIASSQGAIRITPVRHASLLIEAGSTVIAVDPWSQGNYEGLPQAGLVLITDNHGDHYDPAAIAKIRKPDAVMIAPAVVAAKAEGARQIANGEKTSWQGWTIEAVPMYNLKRGPSEGKFFHEKGRGNGYVLTFGGTRIYIAGDTEGIPEMRALRNIDVAFVPMNLPYTMTAEEAAEAVRSFHPKVVYPYHYRGTDTKVFAEALKGSGIEVRLLDWYY